MAAAVQGALYLASILLLGAGVTRRFVHPSREDGTWQRRLRWGAVLGALVVMAGSVADVLITLQGVLGSLEPSIVRDYLASTRHGRATLVRLGLAVIVLALTLPQLRDRADARNRGTTGTLFVLVGAALLGTFSWTSHAAAMGGTPPLLADFVHYLAAAAWAGSILYLALHPRWSQHLPALAAAFRRVSRIGLASVGLLAVSGAYTALIHMQEPERFVASPYGGALGAKLAVVIVIVALAAVNRAWLLPAFARGERPTRFRRAVAAEALLLAGVFVLTGVLTTSPLPHEAGAQPTAAENLVSFLRFLFGR